MELELARGPLQSGGGLRPMLEPLFPTQYPMTNAVYPAYSLEVRSLLQRIGGSYGGKACYVRDRSSA